MTLNPYLTFNGDCEAAFKFYERVLRGKIEALMTHAGTPAEQHVPEEWVKKVMHVRLIVDGFTLMGSDAPPDRYTKPAGISVSIQLSDPAEAERIFTELSDGGTVEMPLQQTFWALRFAMFHDQYGIPWMVNCQSSQL